MSFMHQSPCFECKSAVGTLPHPLVTSALVCEPCAEHFAQPIRTVDALPPRKRSPRSTTGSRPTPAQRRLLADVLEAGRVNFSNAYAASTGHTFATLNACRKRGWLRCTPHASDDFTVLYVVTDAGRVVLGGAQ